MTEIPAEIVPAALLGIKVVSSENGRLELSAPLDKNRNDKGTGFAGSISSMLALAGWGVVTASLQEQAIDADVMIVRSEIEYLNPVRADFSSRAHLAEEARAMMVRELKERGRCRIELHAHLISDDVQCASMRASYAIVQHQ